MATIITAFFATKYWQDTDEIERVFSEIKETFAPREIIKIVDGDLSGLKAESGDDSIVIIPCSGSVQPDIIKASKGFKNKIMFASYIEGNFKAATTDRMLYCNAAPTFIETYSILRREGNVKLIKTTKELKAYLNAAEAAVRIRHSKIGIIGAPEPWVISVSRDFDKYKKQTGIDIVQIQQSELAELYNSAAEEEYRHIYDYYKGKAAEIAEPTDIDILNAAKMAGAMLKIIKKYGVDGVAVACFDLISKTGINPCIGVSYINGETPYFAACEGDLDSAVTMLFVRALTQDSPWMANPNLQKNDTVNFVHCTAPIGNNRFILRNHHETGVGVSPQVEYGLEPVVTAIRYSAESNSITINKGRCVEGRYEPCCRTQVHIEFEDFEHYINTVPGCHQVIVFSDISDAVASAAQIMGIETI